MDEKPKNIGTDSPAAKKAESEARERADELDKKSTTESLTPTFEKGTKQIRQPPPQ